jgi:hypothetical protein
MGAGPAFLLVFGAGLGALLASMVARATVTTETRRRHHEVGIAVFLQLGVIYAVLLAFVFDEAWSEYTQAGAAINAECGSLHEAGMLAQSLRQPGRADMTQALVRYTDAVLHEEWPRMAAGRAAAPQAQAAQSHLMEVAGRLAGEPGGSAVTGRLLEALGQAHSARETRLFQLVTGLPVFLWAILVAFGGVLVLFVAFAGVESAAMLSSLSLIFGLAVGGILVLIRLLDYPFEGALALPADDFAETLAKLRALAGV